MKQRLLQKIGLAALGAVLLSLSTIVPSHAMQFNLGTDTTLDMDVALTYGAAWRTSDQDKALLANINGDDGNRNFDKWDMINNRFSVVVDMDLNHNDKYGLFVRPRAYYDFAYNTRTSNDSPGTWNNNPPVDHKHFDPRAQDTYRDRAEILDAFVYSNFDLGGHHTSLRVGRQVVSWGESIFVGGISTAMSPVDATAANSPGIEVKEILLPVGQVYSTFGLTKNLNLAGYYQWEWEKTRLHEQGGFFSTADFLDEAGRRFLLPGGGAIQRGHDDEPSDSGQYGVALRYVAPWLHETEFGLYHINYHNKGPEVIFGEVPGRYFLRYSEDIKLYGASFGTVLGSTNVGGEISYRKDLPLSVIGGNGYHRGNALQAQVSAIHALYGLPWYLGQMTLIGEIGWNKVSGYGGAKLRNDESAWGGAVQVSPTYFSVLPNLDLSVPITYRFNPHGVSSIGGTFSEKADSFGIAMNFTYKQIYQLGIAYTNNVGGAGHQANADRDFLSLNLKYTF